MVGWGGEGSDEAENENLPLRLHMMCFPKNLQSSEKITGLDTTTGVSTWCVTRLLVHCVTAHFSPAVYSKLLENVPID